VAAAEASDSFLYPGEYQHVERAVERRRREFATGRALARRLLRTLGHADAPLLPGPDRTPLWPPGIVGSITHAGGVCAVTVARAAEIRALGIDVEPARPLEPDLWPSVCTATEREWLHRYAEPRRGLLGKVVFSAKEAVYKCQHPLTRVVLDFPDVELALDEERGIVAPRLPAAVERALPAPIAVRFALESGWIAAAAWVAA
jgi:4'-phosphopantetheinyl transferase EntD